MTSKAGFQRLAAEIQSDIDAADGKATALRAWTLRLAESDEAFIPAGLLHHFYTAVEAAVARTIKTFEGSVPAGAEFHKHLLRLSTLEIAGLRPAVFDSRDEIVLRDLLDFRHFFRHWYGAELDRERLRILAQKAVSAWPTFRGKLEALVAFVRACADRLPPP